MCYNVDTIDEVMLSRLKISFVIPAYNEELLLGNCINSILQAAKPSGCEIEIIVVNNASTDNTKIIAASFPSVHVVDEPLKGLSRARQSGFAASTGDLIANIDADTMITPDWINIVFREFTKNPKLSALSGPFIYHDVPRSLRVQIRIFYYAAFISYAFNRFILRVGSMLQGGNFVIRRSALEAVGGFNPEFVFYGEDTDIARRLHKIGQVRFTFGLPAYSSGRRIVEEGALTMAARYASNHFWTIFFKKPFTKEFLDIRPTASSQKKPQRWIIIMRSWVLPTIVSSVMIIIAITSIFFAISYKKTGSFKDTSKHLAAVYSYVFTDEEHEQHH